MATTKDLLRQIIALMDYMDSRFDAIERRLDILVENASPQAPALAIVDDEAPSEEPSCEEQSCDDELSADEPSWDETPCQIEPCQIEPCQIEPSCKPVYEPLRHQVKLSIRHQNKPSNRTQIEPPSKSFRADDDVAIDTSCDAYTQG
jgi:hypothetical protein